MPRPNPLPIAGLLAIILSALPAAAAPPNVVFILADDVGLGDLSRHVRGLGREPLVETPHLDALADAAVVFADAHSSTALCSPSRYSAMTGNLPHRSRNPWGVWGTFRPSPVTDDDATLGRVARAGGLATGFFGKWHLGGDFRHATEDKLYRGNDRGDEPLPVDVSEWVGGGPRELGFDESFAMPCGVQGPVYVAYENQRWWPFGADAQLVNLTDANALDPLFVSDKGPGPGDSHWDARRVGTLLAERAADFITRHAADGRPFFACYWTPAVHIPHTPPETFFGTPVRGVTPTSHLDMLRELDLQVGHLVAALRDAGVYDDTLIVFSSDNGGLHVGGGNGPAAAHDSSGVFRGKKNDPWEGGHRVPFFLKPPVAWDVEPHTSDAVVTIHDVVATLAGATGVPLEPHQAVDAIDLRPVLADPAAAEAARPDLLLQGGSRNELIYRRGHWKLVIQSNGLLTKWEPSALYDLAEHPTEPPERNRVHDPEQAERVVEMMTRYRERRDAPRTTPPSRR